MSTLAFETAWLDPPASGEAFGPERATWARITIRRDGVPLTAHASSARRDARADSVVGGMAALAEWVVDHWLANLWEIHTPFAKAPVAAPEGAALPSLQDALGGWSKWVGAGIDTRLIASWQRRHALGQARSSIALPTILFLPERRSVGVSWGPAADLGSNVSFECPPEGREPAWLSKPDFADALGGFVEATISRAAASSDGADWAAWLRHRWVAAKRRASEDEERRRWAYGEDVARGWRDYENKLGELLPALEGWLEDVPPLDEKDADHLVALISKKDSSLAQSDTWLRKVKGVDTALKPFVQGYALAGSVRKALGAGDAPLLDLHGTLADAGVRMAPCAARGLFRSAYLHPRRGASWVLFPNDLPSMGHAPTRFAVAAAFGRLVADASMEPSTPRGGAHGPQARWAETQRANAFAAEFLLPSAAFAHHGADVEGLAEQYGISRSAAMWHVHNRAST